MLLKWYCRYEFIIMKKLTWFLLLTHSVLVLLTLLKVYDIYLVYRFDHKVVLTRVKDRSRNRNLHIRDYTFEENQRMMRFLKNGFSGKDLGGLQIFRKENFLIAELSYQ
jgi:hypothetical protein